MENLHPADELLELRIEKAAIEKRIDDLRSEIMELPETERDGKYTVTKVTQQIRRKLDMEKVKYEMGQKWIDQRSSETTIMVVKVSAL